MAGFRFSVYRRALAAVLNARVLPSEMSPACASSRSSPSVARTSRLPRLRRRRHGHARRQRRGTAIRTIRTIQDDPKRRDGARGTAGERSKASSSPRSTTYGDKNGDFWVEEPEGGAFSGIHVFGAPLDQVAALARRRHRRHRRRAEGRVRTTTATRLGRFNTARDHRAQAGRRAAR